MAKKNNEDRRPLPPYIPFKTFNGFVTRLNETATPSRVDSSLLRTYSGSVGRQVVAALKFLKLIGENGTTTDSLKQLVDAYGTDKWQAVLGNIIRDAYFSLLTDLNLSNATPGELEQRFRIWGAEGEVLARCVNFYVAAMLDARETISPHIVNRPRTRSERGRGRPRKAQQQKFSIEEGGAEVQPHAGTARFAFPIPNKAAATIYLPSDLSTEDWEMVDSMIRAYIQRGQKKEK